MLRGSRSMWDNYMPFVNKFLLKSIMKKAKIRTDGNKQRHLLQLHLFCFIFAQNIKKEY